MPWQVRHEGSPQVVRDLTLQQIVDGLRDGLWETTDEVVGPGETRWQPIESHPQLADVAMDLEDLRPPRHQEATSLDMNALIDVCLVLLIFFILTTSYANLVQKVVPMATGRSEAKARAVKAQDVRKQYIQVEAVADKNGKPTVRVQLQPVDVLAADGKTIDAAKVKTALQPYLRGEDRKTEMILDARGVSWETVIQIQDAARSAGVQKIRYPVAAKAGG
jgi:biopolymer transport protein ExbD